MSTNHASFQTLLRYGANPDLRDEDGKTPLDKARERGDEGHREVISILQSPGEWMVPVGRDKTPASSPQDNNSANIAQAIEKPEGESTPEADKEEDASEPKGDPEMAPVYLRRLLPIFTQVYQSTMLPSVR